jgi:hypothetical protein
MDPWIEAQEWEDFHTTFMTVAREVLLPSVRPRYEVKVERRVYVSRAADAEDVVIPDVAVFHAYSGNPEPGAGPSASESNGGATATIVRPVKCRLPMREQKRETFLTIRRTGEKAVITVLELLSPDNKRRGAKGRRLYLRKRNLVLDSRTNLVELDLLRGGQRLPMRDPLPAAQYYALVSRAGHAEADVYAWNLRDPLPPVPIPLAAGDGDVLLDLQQVFTTVYDRAGYDYTLDYTAPLARSLPDPDSAWADALLEPSRRRHHDRTIPPAPPPP